jgi:hypothetical protein
VLDPSGTSSLDSVVAHLSLSRQHEFQVPTGRDDLGSV